MNVHNSFIYKSPKLEVTQMSSMLKWKSVVYYSAIKKKELWMHTAM